MNSKLVTITMPYYKGEDYIEESVQSLVNQTYDNLELIVVDDCSPGASAKQVLKNFDLPWLKIIEHKTNHGLAAARNTGHEQSNGAYIVPLDCDDILKPSFIEKCVNFLDSRDEFDAVFSQVEIFGDSEEIWSPECSMVGIMAGNPVPSTIMYKRQLFDAVDGYRKGMRRSIDSDFWIRALDKGFKVYRLEEPLFKYRKLPQSMSSSYQLTEVTDLAKVNEELYIENMHEILAKFEKKYNILKNEYQTLDNGFKKLENGYFDLLSRYDNVVKKLQSRSIKYQLNKLLGAEEKKQDPT